jgi:hypothetical protein
VEAGERSRREGGVGGRRKTRRIRRNKRGDQDRAVKRKQLVLAVTTY